MKIYFSFLLLLNINYLLPNAPIYISLGSSCGPAMMLRDLGLRDKAYPFDWIVSPYESILESINDDFTKFFSSLNINPIYNEGVTNYYGFYFPHDWPTIKKPNIYDIKSSDFVKKGIIHANWNEATPIVQERYSRRIKRFTNACLGQNKIFFIRTDIDGDTTASLEESIKNKSYAIKLVNIIKAKYPKLDFTIIVFGKHEIFKEDWHAENIKNFYSISWCNTTDLKNAINEINLKQKDAYYAY
jgi:hypothetical protein